MRIEYVSKDAVAKIIAWNLSPKATIEAINDLPTVPQWIPCSEKPDTDRNVFIARGTQDNMTACIGHYDHDYKEWYENRNWFATLLYDGLYWCEIPPLPAPYKEA